MLLSVKNNSKQAQSFVKYAKTLPFIELIDIREDIEIEEVEDNELLQMMLEKKKKEFVNLEKFKNKLRNRIL